MMTCALKTQCRSRAICKEEVPEAALARSLSLETTCRSQTPAVWDTVGSGWDLSHSCRSLLCSQLCSCVAPSIPSFDTSALGSVHVFFRASCQVWSWARGQFLLQARKSPQPSSSWEPAALHSACPWPPSPARSHTWTSPFPPVGTSLITGQRQGFALAQLQEKGPSPG